MQTIPDALTIRHHRRGLERTRRAIQSGALTIGFLGGSITDGRAAESWAEPVIAWFVDTFPGLRVTVENAGIGGTGSDSAVFRVDRTILQPDCDLLFVEYAANDHDTPSATRRRTQEGLIRKALAGAGRDVVLTYTFLPAMLDDILSGTVPSTIAEFEELADHYGLGSAWMGLHALREVQSGALRWEEWLPDGIHPQVRGSLSYASSVIPLLERELVSDPSPGSAPTGDARPDPLDPLNWEHAYALPFGDVAFDGPWTIRRSFTFGIDRAIDTSAVGAELHWRFTGRALSLGWACGFRSADFAVRIDDGEWVRHSPTRPEWAEATGWYRTMTLADGLAPGEHTATLRVLHPGVDGPTGTTMRIGCIGVVP